MESAHRRATLTKEPHHLPYDERLKRLGLNDLRTRRERADSDLKLVHGIDKVNWCENNKIIRSNQTPDRLRRNFQLLRERTKGNEARQKFLLNRMARRCSKTLPFDWEDYFFPKKIGLAPSVNSFKN